MGAISADRIGKGGSSEEVTLEACLHVSLVSTLCPCWILFIVGKLVMGIP